MIFVTLGNQNFQFNRLLIALERLVEEGIINEEIIIQCGHTDYKSDLFKTVTFLGKKEFDIYIETANYVISHAGTGSIVNCLKKGKKVLVAARLSKYGEHIDDHQKEILFAFEKMKLIVGLDHELKDFKDKVENLQNIRLEKFVSNNESFNKELIKIIEQL
ncbi:glycosyltransferase [Maribacter sp. 2210JD10-5]|uniref:glycosyltransferase n=1 Tax=Maribacter sp. 2210JD10-5 TaxID=3386272 RepID=UPI0039BD60C7